MAKSYGMQYLSGSDNLEKVIIDDLAELDQKLSELIESGEKVVLLGDQVWVVIYRFYTETNQSSFKLTRTQGFETMVFRFQILL